MLTAELKLRQSCCTVRQSMVA